MRVSEIRVKRIRVNQGLGSKIRVIQVVNTTWSEMRVSEGISVS